jgi:dTDP-4-dehydrorhamnose 3,5-epimerase
MEIVQELLPGVFVLKPQIFGDNRGSLSVPFEAKALEYCVGRPFNVAQTMCSISRKNVIRGLHYQNANAPVAKLVSCARGVIYDVIIDLRRKSSFYGEGACIELSPADGYQVYVPVGCAHGYLSLTDRSEVFYYQDGLYSPEASKILAWNDPDLAVNWPVKQPILSDRDRTQGGSWQDYKRNPIF